MNWSLLDVPYVAASPFWWKIRVKGNLKWSDMCMVCLLFMKCSKGLSGTQFNSAAQFEWEQFLCLMFYLCRSKSCLDLWLCGVSKGKKDLYVEPWIHCDDLLWLESLIDGWGQTLTLITETTHPYSPDAWPSPNFCPLAECSPDCILHLLPTSNMLCPIQVHFVLYSSQEC